MPILFTLAETPGGGATGTVSVALGRLSVAVAGTGKSTGTASAALGQITVSVTGGAPYTSGTVGVLLSQVTVAVAGGTHTGTGSIAVSLSKVAVAAAGVGKATGTVAVTLSAVTVDAEGTDTSIGSVNVTLPALAVSVAGVQGSVTGTVSVGLKRIAVSAGNVPSGVIAYQYYGSRYWGGAGGGGSAVCDYPDKDDVRFGVVYSNGAITGDMTLPLTSDVRAGIQYGTNGIQYTGTLAISSPADPDATIHSQAEVIRQLLIDGAVATVPGAGYDWPVYATNEPSAPDSVITVYDTTGQLEGRDQLTGERVYHLGIQIRVRAETHNRGYAKAHAIASYLDKNVIRNTVTIGSVSYCVQSVSRGDIMVLGKESPTSKRSLFTLNGTVSLKPTY